MCKADGTATRVELYWQPGAEAPASLLQTTTSDPDTGAWRFEGLLGPVEDFFVEIAAGSLE